GGGLNGWGRRVARGVGRATPGGPGAAGRCGGGVLVGRRRAGPIVPRWLVVEHPDVLQFWLPGRVGRCHAGRPQMLVGLAGQAAYRSVPRDWRAAPKSASPA